MNRSREKCSKWFTFISLRYVEDEEISRWTMPKDLQPAWHGLFFLYARFSRQEIYPKCPEKAIKMISRIERIRSYTAYHLCNTPQISNIELCDKFAKLKTSGTPRKNTELKKQSAEKRHEMLSNYACEESKFGTDYAELTCPFGGLIRIYSATFGRSDEKKCGGGKIFDSCDFEINFKYIARKQCEKKSECTFLARKAPRRKIFDHNHPCYGVPLYTQLFYTCD